MLWRIIIAAIMGALAGIGGVKYAQGAEVHKTRMYMVLGAPTPFESLFQSEDYWKALELVHQTGMAADSTIYWTIRHWWWSQWICDDVTEAYQQDNTIKIILMGHSYGASAAMSISRCISARQIPVKLVLDFDLIGRPFFQQEHLAGSTVETIVNYYETIDPLLSGWSPVDREGLYKDNIENIELFPPSAIGAHGQLLLEAINNANVLYKVQQALR